MFASHRREYPIVVSSRHVLSLRRAGWHKASQCRYIHDVRVRIRSWGWTITSSRIRLVAMARVGVSSRAVAAFAEMTASQQATTVEPKLKLHPKAGSRLKSCQNYMAYVV